MYLCCPAGGLAAGARASFVLLGFAAECVPSQQPIFTGNRRLLGILAQQKLTPQLLFQ